MKDYRFHEVSQVIESIPQDTFGGDQPEYLFRLSMEQALTGAVVEIGTNVGKSTIALAFAEKCRDGNKITTIDIFQHPDIERNLEAAGVNRFVHRVVAPSHVVAKRWTEPIRLLWIDGDHCFRGVYNDLRNWAAKVVPGGLVVLHDYPGHQASRAVQRAVQRSILNDPYRFKVLHDRVTGSIMV